MVTGPTNFHPLFMLLLIHHSRLGWWHLLMPLLAVLPVFIFFSPVSENELCRYVQALDTYKSVVSDGFSTKILREWATSLPRSLTKALNCSRSLACFQTCSKWRLKLMFSKLVIYKERKTTGQYYCCRLWARFTKAFLGTLANKKRNILLRAHFWTCSFHVV